MKPSKPEIFWSKVAIGDECWEWQGRRNSDGYGTCPVYLDEDRAHRASWAHWFGPIPNGLHVLHKCDNPACVRPDHLFTGYQRDNVADMVAKNRMVSLRGEAHGMSKLTEVQALEVKQRLASGESASKLGREYCVKRPAIWKIKAGINWAHLTLPQKTPQPDPQSSAS